MIAPYEQRAHDVDKKLGEYLANGVSAQKLRCIGKQLTGLRLGAQIVNTEIPKTERERELWWTKSMEDKCE